MFRRLRKMEIMDETKKLFKAMKDELEKDIAAGQQEMRFGQQEMRAAQGKMKESYNAMKEEIKRDIATGQEELKASLSSLMKELLDEKLSCVKNKINSVGAKVKEIEKDLGQEIVHIKKSLV